MTSVDIMYFNCKESKYFMISHDTLHISTIVPLHVVSLRLWFDQHKPCYIRVSYHIKHDHAQSLTVARPTHDCVRIQ